METDRLEYRARANYDDLRRPTHWTPDAFTALLGHLHAAEAALRMEGYRAAATAVADARDLLELVVTPEGDV